MTLATDPSHTEDLLAFLKDSSSPTTPWRRPLAAWRRPASPS